MSCPSVGATNITNGVSNVDCEKQVRSWRLLRALMALLIPTCSCTFVEDHEIKQENKLQTRYPYSPKQNLTASSTITGTIFGYRRGKLSFCIQTNSKAAANPILLLELAVPTTILAREMQGGVLRIALDCTGSEYNATSNSRSLLSMPVWVMYCNGRRVGYAVKRRPSKADMDALQLMGSVVAGAGIISGKELDRDDELMYLRANFERVCGSSDAESFHLIDPDGSIGQELSIFFFRSR